MFPNLILQKFNSKPVIAMPKPKDAQKGRKDIKATIKVKWRNHSPIVQSVALEPIQAIFKNIDQPY